MHSGHSGATARATSGSGELNSHVSVSCNHEVQFYVDDRFLIQSLSTYIRNALENGSSAIVVATEAHRMDVAQELRRTGFDLTPAVDAGRYVPLDASETLERFLVNGSPDNDLFRQIIGDVISCAAYVAVREDSKVVIFGEMVALLWQRGQVQAALRLEQMWNELSEYYSFQLRCAYPIASFDHDSDTEVFNQICAEHDVVIPAEGHSDLEERGDWARTIALLQQTEQVLRAEAVGRRIAEAQKREEQNRNLQLVDEIRKHEVVEEELRKFTRRLLNARDEEQRRIAAELHENTAQLLAALSLYFGVMHQEKASLNPRLARAVANSRSVSDNLLAEIRKLSYLLHPPTLDEMGLASALNEYVDQFVNCGEAKVDLKIDQDLGRFDRKLELSVFRIVEEALANIPNSGGTPTTVCVKRSSAELVVDIEIPVKRDRDSRFTGIHARVMEHHGSIQFTSNPKGTQLCVKLPLEESPRSAA